MCVFWGGVKSIFGWSRDILIQVGPPNHFDLATALCYIRLGVILCPLVLFDIGKDTKNDITVHKTIILNIKINILSTLMIRYYHVIQFTVIFIMAVKMLIN